MKQKLEITGVKSSDKEDELMRLNGTIRKLEILEHDGDLHEKEQKNEEKIWSEGKTEDGVFLEAQEAISGRKDGMMLRPESAEDTPGKDKNEEQTNRKEDPSSIQEINDADDRRNENDDETITSPEVTAPSNRKQKWIALIKLYGPRYVSIFMIGLSAWLILYSVAGEEFLPGTQLFSLAVLFTAAFIAGQIIRVLPLPPLLGMLIAGILLRYFGVVHLTGVYAEVAASLREIALCVILIRAGLGLDPAALKNLSMIILRLACMPALVEGSCTAILSHYLLGLPWMWGILLGAILAAVSPAVVIPCLFNLQRMGYGTDKGIPTLVVAAASLDDIIAISVFGVVLSVIFSTGTNLAMQISQGPLGIIIGIVFGIVWGKLLHIFPNEKDENLAILRTIMLAGGGLMAIFGSSAVGFQGAGPLGCIVAAFVACVRWREEGYTDKNNPVGRAFAVIWEVCQPVLFGLIGSEVDVNVLEGSMVLYGCISLLLSLLARIVTSTLVAFGGGFNWKEKIFIAWAWFPKATVQAALGPLALDIARWKGTPQEIEYATTVLIVAVLAILITAPVGAILITVLGRVLLTPNALAEDKPLKGDDVPEPESNKEVTQNIN